MCANGGGDKGLLVCVCVCVCVCVDVQCVWMCMCKGVCICVCIHVCRYSTYVGMGLLLSSLPVMDTRPRQ